MQRATVIHCAPLPNLYCFNPDRNLTVRYLFDPTFDLGCPDLLEQVKMLWIRGAYKGQRLGSEVRGIRGSGQGQVSRGVRE